MDSKISKGLKVEVRFADSPAAMIGTILQVDSNALVVSLTHDEGRVQPKTSLNLAGDVQVVTTADDALYQFTSRLLQSAGLLLYLSLPREVHRVQRREDVRQPCLFDVELDIPGGGRVPVKRERATAVNISCGGLLIVFNGGLVEGDPVALSMTLPGGEPPIRVAARVVRTEPFSHLGQDLSRVALRVERLQPADRKRLTQFIMKCQVKARTGMA